MTDQPIAVITGATGGMGRAIAADLAVDHTVYALGRNREALDALGAIDNVTAVEIDLTDDAQRADFAAGLTADVDVLIHAAALGDHLSVEKAEPADWRRNFEANVFAPADLTRLLLPGIRRAHGTIVFVGSGASTKPTPGHAVYVASKHALKGLADTLRIDEAQHRVRVVTAAPGQTATGMLQTTFEQRGLPWEPARYIQPDSIARSIRFIVDATDDVQLTDIAIRPRVEL